MTFRRLGAIAAWMGLMGCGSTGGDGGFQAPPASTVAQETSGNDAGPEVREAGAEAAAPPLDAGAGRDAALSIPDAAPDAPHPSAYAICVSTCSGCCDADGGCENPGDTACGFSGTFCQDCTLSGGYCSQVTRGCSN